MSRASRIVRSTCRICYDSCGILIHVEGGKPVKVEGDPQNPMSRGKLCPKGQASLEYLNHPERLTSPLRRTGRRGSSSWKKVGWPEALSAVADGLTAAKAKDGVLSTVFIRGASKGLSDDLLARFANIFGSPNITSPAPYCFVPGARAAQLTYGYYSYPDYQVTPKTIVVWGTNPASTNPPDFEEIQNAREEGARLIVIDPLESELARTADIWIRVRPGTDAALCLGFLHVLVKNSLYDRSFVENWTTGFDALKEHVKAFSPQRVEAITWVPAQIIREAAVAYAESRPALILWGNGLETNVNSFHACRAIAILRAVSGNLGIPGGEVKYGLPGGLVRGDPEFVCQNHIPAAVRQRRLSANDGILPVNYYSLPQRIVKAILDGDPYPVRAAYVQGANILTHWPNAHKTLKAVEKLDFLVVADQFMTPTAALADIVLPVASYLEFDSVEQPWHFPIASVQQKVAQVGESWSDGMILNELTRTLGFAEYTYADLVQILERIMEPSGVSFDQFRDVGFFVGERTYNHHENGGFDTESKKVELFSSQLARWGFDPLPTYQELPETMFSDPQLAKEFPLIMTSRKAAVYRHSGGRQIQSLRAKNPEPIVKVHPDTAEKLAIENGEVVYIETKRGRIEQRVEYCPSLDPRVVEVDYAWWFPEKDKNHGWELSNINILTDDAPPYNREMGSPNMRGILCRVSKKTS